MNAVWGFVSPTTKQTIYSTDLYLWTFGLAMVQVLQQICGIISMKYNRAGYQSTISFLVIPFGYFLDWLVVEQKLDALELIGAAIICVTNMGITTMRLKGIID